MSSETNLSFYVNEETKAEIERIAKRMHKRGIEGLYKTDGKLNRSAFLYQLVLIAGKLFPEESK